VATPRIPENLGEFARGIYARTVGKETQSYATTLINLGEVYRSQGKLSEAIGLYDEAPVITARTVGKETDSDATTLNNLAGVYESQRKLSEAIALFEEALGIYARTVGKETESYALTLINLGEVYRSQGKLSEAIGLFEPLRSLPSFTFSSSASLSPSLSLHRPQLCQKFLDFL
jgi:tetratricopeptide (TPR) repeat protein